MDSLETQFKKLEIFFHKAQKIGILSHKGPDGDTIGCNIALSLALKQMGKQVDSICCDHIDEKYSFLSEVSSFQNYIDPENYDLLIAVDLPAEKMAGFEDQHEQIFSFFPFVNIDHHPDNPYFGNVNIVDPSASSASIIIFRILDFLNVPITRDIATAILMGIYTDTGSFMHGNTTPEAYEIAAKLILLGADTKSITDHLFQNFPLQKLRLWGDVLSRVRMNPDKVVSSLVTKEDFEKTGTTSDDLYGMVEYLNMVPGAKFAMLLTEDEKNQQVKASLRTLNDDVDVSAIAHKYGGGGHKKASGFRIPGAIEEEVRWTIVDTKGTKDVDAL